MDDVASPQEDELPVHQQGRQVGGLARVPLEQGVVLPLPAHKNTLLDLFCVPSRGETV